MDNEGRFASEKLKLEKLQRAIVNLRESNQIWQTNLRERDAYVKRFELAFELTWKFLKSYLIRAHKPDTSIESPRSTIRYAADLGLLPDERLWLDMLIARNNAVHAYDNDDIQKLAEQIHEKYCSALESQCISMSHWKF
jgi:nucleotidyltransferase substrate binding protein (TIGR01987 family)